MGSNKTVVWFRRDLRIDDNPALAASARDGSIIPVYIWCPKEEGQFYPGRVSRWWLKHSLIHLQQSLKSLGSELVLIKTESTISALLDCIHAMGATKLYFNHLYDPVSLVRDHNIKENLAGLGISVKSFNGDLLYEPWEVYDEHGHAFTIFEEYWSVCSNIQKEPQTLLPPCRLVSASATGSIEKCSVEDLGLEDESEKASNALLGRGWSPGWSNADKALTNFIEHHLLDYSNNRLRVGGNSTSILSPYLHYGELSVRKVFHCARMKQILWTKEENFDGQESVALFLRAIGLREYSRYLCFNYPFTHERSLLSNLKYFPWHPNQAHFKAWRQGRTGYPLVDAGMRELWATGWVHNRIRVIVSSFAVKVLLLPWKWGMKYFWDTLLDADLESDILGWQYISGSLPDGHELERLESPEMQGSKFDPEGEYVRQWLPELARMPTQWIHHPWDASPSILKSAGVELGLNYPKPIIDIDLARDNLTKAIFIMWETEAHARADTSNGTSEVVVDNSNGIESSPIPKVVVKEQAHCHTISSNDQKVPSVQNFNNLVNTKKRPKCMEEENPAAEESGVLRPNEDLCSTAESSATKKQETSICSFSVPQLCSWSNGKTMQNGESSSLNWQSEGQVNVEQSSGREDQ